MKAANDPRFAADALRADFAHAEPDTTDHATDHADGANWESAWIDLGGEG